MTVDMQVWLSVLVNLTLLIAAAVAGVRWLRRWLRDQVTPVAQQTTKQSETNHPLSDVLNQFGHRLRYIDERCDELDKRMNHHSELLMYTLQRVNDVERKRPDA